MHNVVVMFSIFSSVTPPQIDTHTFILNIFLLQGNVIGSHLRIEFILKYNGLIEFLINICTILGIQCGRYEEDMFSYIFTLFR